MQTCKGYSASPPSHPTTRPFHCCHVCAFFTLYRSFYPSTSKTPSFPADSSSLPTVGQYYLSGSPPEPNDNFWWIVLMGGSLSCLHYVSNVWSGCNRLCHFDLKFSKNTHKQASHWSRPLAAWTLIRIVPEAWFGRENEKTRMGGIGDSLPLRPEWFILFSSLISFCHV